ncbi:MAG TPA: type II and III secretion system protein family protein [Stellaceae bacterium]
MNRRSVAAQFFALGLAVALAVLPIGGAARAAQVIRPTGAPITLDVSKGLIIRLDRPCSSVFVADPDVADVQLKSPTVLYLMGKAAGETTVYAVDQQDAVLLDSRVEVHQDIDRLQREIQQIDPSHKIQAKAVDDSIVLEGSVADAAEGDDIRKIAARYVATPAQLVNKLTLDAPNQIDLQVRIAEVQRNVLKQFGINWENIQQSSMASFGFVNATPALVPPIPTTGAAGLGGFNTPTGTLIGNATNNNIFASLRNGNFFINAVVDALAQQGLITILAEPNLVTVSGQKANFLAGGEFPVPVPQSGGTNGIAAITIDWKQFGVSLNFTPTILADGRIALHVAPEVSELAPNQGVTIEGVSVPGITTRRADTTVELGSGQTFAIAGLLQNTTQQQLNSYPWIADIPIIGSLFRSTAFERGESELVILVTPYLVQPVSSATALRTGNDGFYAPGDKDRVLNGDLNARPTPGSPAGTSGLTANPAPTAMIQPTPSAANAMAVAPTPPAPSAGASPAIAAPPPAFVPAPRSSPGAAAPAHSPATASGFEID